MAKIIKATDNTQQIKLSLINVNEFINFLKKFSSQEPNVLMELRGDQKFLIKTTTPKTANIIKVSEIVFDEIFMTDDDLPDNIFIGVYNINNFINTFNLLDEDKISITLFYEKNKKSENICKRISIETNNLKYHFANAPKESFQYLEDKMVDQIFNPSEYAFEFELNKILLTKIKDLVSNEAAKMFSLSAEVNDNVYCKGKQFELKITTPQSINEDATVNIGKQYLTSIDRETYDVYVVSKGILLKSKDSSTFIAIAREKDITDNMEIV